MKSLIIRILQKIIYKTSLQSFIFEQRNRDIIAQNKSMVSGNGFFIYADTIIANMQNNPKAITIGENTHCRGTLLVFKYGGKITIGNNCYIGDGTRIWSGEEVIIGNDVLIAHMANIVDTQAHEIDATERAERYIELQKSGPWSDKGSIQTKPVIIKDKVWISFNVAILKGVTIGEGAIVAAGSVVTKNVEPYTMVAGNPAVVVKKLN